MRDFIKLLGNYLEYLQILGIDSLPAYPEIKSFLELDPLVPESLEELEREIKACRKCPLHRTRTQAVPGEGPTPCEIMIVGEAPGRPGASPTIMISQGVGPSPGTAWVRVR